MVRENVLTTDDLIWPLFVVDGDNTRAPVASMPGVERLTVDQVVREAERAAKLDHPLHRAVPLHRPGAARRGRLRGAQPRQSGLPGGRARSRRRFPSIGVLCDVALDPFTSHGHDGLIARRRDPQRRDGRGAGAAGAGAGRGRLRHHRAVRHDGRPRRRDPRGARRRQASPTCRSWPTRRNTPRPSTARSATRSARRRR